MIQIKKTLLTLVALLAVTTGAWAQDPNAVTAAEINSVVYSGWSSIDGKLFKASELPGFQAVTENQAKSWAGVPSTGEVILYYEFVADGNVKAVKFKNGVYDSSFEETELTCNLIWEDIVYSGDKKYFYTTGPAPASGPEVAWTAASKTGTFTMPGGNVTLEPDYYPQATVADGGVTAADADARATTDDPLVKVDATKLTGAKKLMYFVSNSGTTAPAYDAEGWTDQLPNAEGFTQQGIVYVWYYPVGIDEGVDGATATYSDGDICLQSITARIAAEPTYAVTFADGVNPEPPAEPEWTASPATDVKKGQTVTVTYSGTKKVIGVKAEKKAAVTYPLLSAATTSDQGKVVCAAGHLHDAKTAVPDGCTAVGILGKVTSTGHGLILALKDATSQNWNTINGWTSASYAGTTLKVLPDDAARGTNLTSYTTLGETAVSNWAVGQKSDYEAIFTNLGSTVSDSYGTTYDDNVNAYITDAGGTAITGGYWSTSYDGGNYSWIFSSDYWDSYNMSNSHSVRPVLGF